MVSSHRLPQLRSGGSTGFFSENSGPLVHETSPFPRTLVRCHHRPQAKNGQKVLLLRPSACNRGGQGALSPFCLTRDAILPLSAGIHSG